MAHRLLVVPGENEVLRALPEQLGDDIEVRVLDSANDALWEVRSSPPEVIVADLQLEGMSGLDLAEILPNFGVSTKVVLWSRQPNQQAAQQASSHGVYRFLNGPLSSDELHSALRDAIRQHEEEAKATPPAEPEPSVPTAASPPDTIPQKEAVEKPAADRTARRLSAGATSHSGSKPGRETPEPQASDRSRRDRPTPGEPPAAAAESPARKPPARRTGGPLVLTADNLKPIRQRMDGLVQDVGAMCILLADRAGMVLAEVGVTTHLPTMILLPLLSTSFSTASQISQMLREEESTALYMHEGRHYDLYCFDVLQRFMLVILFDKAAPSAKIGSVWVYAKRAIRDIQEFLV